MAKIAAPKPNLLERAISAISPTWALRRHHARVATAMSGGYSGASYADRFAHWMPGNGSADADTVGSLKELRARSRDLVRNSPVAGGAIETNVAHVVGTGLTMQSRVDAALLGLTDEAAAEWQAKAEREFRLWCESTYCDAAEKLNFYGLQDLAYRSMLESGDSFALLPQVRRPNWPHRIVVQVVEADRVSNPDGKADTETLVQGIERAAAGGAPVAVYVADRHPGRYVNTKDTKWSRVAVRGAADRLQVIHLMRTLRPGQTRGVPWLAPIIDIVKQMTRYANAEVDAAVNSAAFAMFVKMDPEAFQDLFDDSSQGAILDAAKQWDGSLRSGQAVNLLPGEEVQSAAMARPNPNFDPFFQSFLCQVGMALNVPYEVLAKKFNSSYSAARASLLDAWRGFRIRRDFLASYFCQPIYEEWLADAVALGRISAPGFFADPILRKAWSGAAWSGDGPGSIDPQKEAAAARERMDIGLTTLPEEIVAYDGGDWETKHREAVRVKEARDRDGLNAAPAPAAAPGQPAGPAKPARQALPDPEDPEDPED